jgi:DinB superfamily
VRVMQEGEIAMSAQTASDDGRAAALAAFDSARDRFLAAFAAAPDAALPFVPAGEEYALGVLPMHLQDPMRHYMAVLDMIQAEGYGPLDLTGTAEEAAISPERHAQIVATRPSGAERVGMLAALAAAHERVRTRVAALDEDTYMRAAPVVYGPGADPYPTSCRDIMGWLTDHYDEHTAQVGQLLEAWRRTT